MLESLFNNFADLQSEILLNERLHHGYFSMKKFYLKNTFLTGHLRATASDTFTLNNSILISIVGTLYLMIRNLNFVCMIDHVLRT